MKTKAFKIPKSFMLHGQVVNVGYKDDLSAKGSMIGVNYNGYNEIFLQPSSKTDPRPQSCVEQSFFHELIHDVLYHMENKLNDDEKFVNLFASLLHEAFVTMEYEEEKKDGKSRSN